MAHGPLVPLLFSPYSRRMKAPVYCAAGRLQTPTLTSCEPPRRPDLSATPSPTSPRARPALRAHLYHRAAAALISSPLPLTSLLRPNKSRPRPALSVPKRRRGLPRQRQLRAYSPVDPVGSLHRGQARAGSRCLPRLPIPSHLWNRSGSSPDV
jgi:hypothetical protein